jgi:hypothetical protein
MCSLSLPLPFSQMAAKERVHAQPEPVRFVQTVLTDTLIKAYLSAYSADSVANFAPPPFDADLHAGGHALMRLACIAQGRFVA